MNFFKIIAFLSVAVLLCTGCGKDGYDFETDEGSVSFSVEASYSTAQPGTKADEESAGNNLNLNVDDFTLEIYKPEGMIRKWKYGEVKGQKMKLNKNQYTVKAYYGDSTATGFDAIYFAGKTPFVIQGQTTTPVSVVCKMANVKVAVQWGVNIANEYADYSAKIYRNGKNGSLVFSKDETRSGYIPAGDLVLEMTMVTNSGEKRVYKAKTVACAANDFITFTIDTKEQQKEEVTVSFRIDSSTTDKDKVVFIPAVLVAAPAPTMNLVGFTAGAENTGSVEFVEAVGFSDNLAVGISAPGLIKSCILITDSEAFPSSWPQSIDLLDENANSSQLSTVRAYGIEWSNMMGEKFGTVSFKKLTELIRRTGNCVNDFTVKVTDAQNKEVSMKVSLNIKEAALAVSSIPAYDMWATKAYVTASTSDGNPEHLTLQYSSDNGANWNSFKAENITVSAGASANSRDFEVRGLASATNYLFRAAYFNSVSTQTQAGKTEAAAQLGNSGFEEWVSRKVVSYTIIGESLQTVYDPWASGSTDKWWDTNNAETTKTSGTPAYLEKKCFPMVSYNKQGRTGRAAQLMAIAVDGSNTNTTSNSNAIAGQLFIGTYGGNEGHSFASRPSSLTFYYTYTPKGDNDDDTFDVYIKVLSGTTVIGEGSMAKRVAKASPVSSWTLAEIPVTYSDNTKTATAVQVRFKSSTASVPPHEKNTSITNGEESSKVHGGSILLVDDMILKY